MSDCLHCEIIDLVQSRIDRGETDLADLAARIAESLAEVVLLAPVNDQSKLMADAIANLGQAFLDKCNLDEASETDARH
jgi:hypothetical protein